MLTPSTTVGPGTPVAEGTTDALIVYAKTGNVAEDGTGPHSPFAAHCCTTSRRRIEVKQMLSRVWCCARETKGAALWYPRYAMICIPVGTSADLGRSDGAAPC
jgi:hypothetical protein